MNVRNFFYCVSLVWIVAFTTAFAQGYHATDDLWIRAVIQSEEKGSIDAVWQHGGTGTTNRGDKVIWGHFYANPDDVAWGSLNNPDLYVKIWFDVSGRVDVNFFHVSVPDIDVYSDYPVDGTVDAHGKTTMSSRYIRHYYENGQVASEINTEDGNPPAGRSAAGSPSGIRTINTLNIGSIINTEDKGFIEAIWRLGGMDTTERGDQVVWGYFYASPSDVSWGNRENPDCYVKIWFDVSGRVDVNFFHVSVPDIEIYSDLPGQSAFNKRDVTIMSNRYVRHEYQTQNLTYDTTGKWAFTVTPDPASLESNTDDCPADEAWDETISITQNGSAFEMITADGNKINGTVNGNQYIASGSWTDEGTSIAISGTLTMTSGGKFTGVIGVYATQGNYYCRWNQTMAGEKMVSFNYIGATPAGDLELDYYDTLASLSTGDILVSSNAMIGKTSPIHVFGSDLNSAGEFKYNSEPVLCQRFLVDGSDNVHTYDVSFGTVNQRIYHTNGTKISEYSSSENVYLANSMDMDTQGCHYLIPFSGSGTGGDRSLFVWKLSSDLKTRLATLEESELLAMLPGNPTDSQVTLNDIKIAPDQKIYIAVDQDDGGTGNDGILVLDQSLKKVHYLGGDWMFNFPRGIAFDGAGNLYVSSTYGNKVSAFSPGFRQIGTITSDTIPSVYETESFLPVDITIQKNRIYVINSKDNRIHVLEFDY